MKKSTKAALLSGLVFPGLGLLYLKRWVSGSLVAGVALYAVYTIASVVIRIALEVAQKIESGMVSTDIDTVTYTVAQELSGSEQATDLASLAIGICWVVGIVGSYWYGRVQEMK